MASASPHRLGEQLLHAFPDALDLLRVCVQAGLGLDAAMERVGREIRHARPELSEEFALTGMALRARDMQRWRARAAAPIARRVLDYLLADIYPSEEDIVAVQQGKATAPIGTPRKASGSRNPDLSVNGLDSVDERDLFRFGIRCGICLGFEDGTLANHLFPKGCLDI